MAWYSVIRRGPLTNIACDVAVQPGEDKVAVLELLWSALPYYELTQLLRHGKSLLPLDGILVLLASRPLRSADCVEGEMWVQGKEEDEALAYGAGCAEDT